MTTYKDLKSATHIEPAIHYAEALLGIRFNRSGEDRYRAFCPFHADTKDSFRVHVDGNDEIRFHCFGGCPGKSDWDIYDIIMLSKKCSFRVAQLTWAEYLGVHDFQPYDGKSDRIPEPDPDQVPDETVDFIEPPELPPEIVSALEEGATFYNELLLSNEDRFNPIFNYLHRRGIDTDIIRQFKIGYAPPFADELYRGRALIKTFLPRFNDDHRTFQPFCKGSLVRLLNDETARGYGYYRQQIDFSDKNPFSRGYGDYFAGRIIFPIYDLNGKPHGIIGRRPDDRGVRWLKQQAKAAITTKSWLYGIDKAARYIKQYRTVILVEGIFDYFAFFSQLQDQQKPVVVSTLGSHFTVEAHSVLKGLGVENFIVAYDRDDAGRNGIKQVVDEVGGRVFYLAGLKEGQDPHDKLKAASRMIDGFSLKHLMTSAKKEQGKTDKPINFELLAPGRPKGHLIFEAAAPGSLLDLPMAPAETKDYVYDTDDFLPLLTYDHGNKALLNATLHQIIKQLEARPTTPKTEKFFTIPAGFLRNEAYEDLGPALILWLRLVIEQQSRKRRVKENDSTLATWFNTSRITVILYKRKLKELGYLIINTDTKPQWLSVRYFPS